MGVLVSWETPAMCILNLKLAGRAEGAEEEAGRRESTTGGMGESKEDGGHSVVIRTFELQKKLINDEAAAGMMLRLEGGPGSD